MRNLIKSDLIRECQEKGIPLSGDFHALRRDKVLELYEMMGNYDFETPSDRSGSRLRYFYYFLSEDRLSSNSHGWLWEAKSYPCDDCGSVCVSVVTHQSGDLGLTEYKSYEVSSTEKNLYWQCEDCL